MNDTKEVKIDTPFDRPEKRVKREAETKAIIIQASATPQQNIDVILLNQHAIQELKKSMTYGVHYGPPYKNSKKDTLLKPGAEWTQKLFGIRPQYEKVESIIQPNFEDLSKSWIMFRYRCQMIEIASGLVVGEAIGTCHSLEDKYHWRNGQLQCPHCGQETLIISKRNQNAYWCNTYNGGCGKETPKNAPEITSQQVGKVPNANPMDLANTLDKIAQKRAYVSAVLNATAASSIFAPGDDAIDDIDVSDIVEGQYTEAPVDLTPAPVDTTPEPEAKDTPPQTAPINGQLVDAIAYMYPEDKDGFHRRGTVKNLLADGTLAQDMPKYVMVEKILLHRAFKDFMMDEPMVWQALTVDLDNGTEVKGWPDWYAQYKTDEERKQAHPQAWNAIQAYHENANVQPAKAKDEPAPESTGEVPF